MNNNLSDPVTFNRVMSDTKLFGELIEHITGHRLQILKTIKPPISPDRFGQSGVWAEVSFSDFPRSSIFALELNPQESGSPQQQARTLINAATRYLARRYDVDDEPDTHIIIVMTNDFYGKGYASYEFRTGSENVPGLKVDDGLCVTILNARFTHDSEHRNVDDETAEFLELVSGTYDTSQRLSGFAYKVSERLHAL